MSLGIASGIVVIVYIIIEVIKKTVAFSDKSRDLIPICGVVIGVLASLAVFMSGPALGIDIYVGDNMLTAIITGAASGLVATGCNQIVKKAKKLSEGNYDGISDDIDKILDENEDLEIKRK